MLADRKIFVNNAWGATPPPFLIGLIGPISPMSPIGLINKKIRLWRINKTLFWFDDAVI